MAAVSPLWTRKCPRKLRFRFTAQQFNIMEFSEPGLRSMGMVP